MSAKHFCVVADVETREVEECQGVLVADVEEEVRRPRIVAILEQIGQR